MFKEKGFLIAFTLLTILFLSGCPEQNNVSYGVTALPICKLNESPTLFLYPAIDTNSEYPKFFDNTVYEIIQEGKYLGKFKGDRFNHSYLNLSYNSGLTIMVTAENDKCSVLNKIIHYRVPCNYNDYITPEMRCVERIVFDFLDENVSNYINNEDTIKMDENYLIIHLEVFKQGDFNYFGCSYDRNILNFEVKALFIGGDIWQKNQVYKTYELSSSKSYEIILNTHPRQKPFNSTINCMFFDKSIFIENYKIKEDITDKYYNDVGQQNPTFNFTINFRGH